RENHPMSPTIDVCRHHVPIEIEIASRKNAIEIVPNRLLIYFERSAQHRDAFTRHLGWRERIRAEEREDSGTIRIEPTLCGPVRNHKVRPMAASPPVIVIA